MSVELTDTEREMMLELLDTRLGELKEEIHHSRVSEFKDALKVRADCMRELIAKLEQAPESD
jgi:hypothetical protein